eukprot:273140_1
MSVIAAETAPTHSFRWSIPSLSINEKKILCFGYVRKINKKNSLIPQPVADLCAKYFTPNDKFTLDALNDAKPRELFLSPAFAMNDVMFAIGMYPNGYYSKSHGYILPVLRLLSSPTKYSEIRAYFTLETTAYIRSKSESKMLIKKHSVTEYCYDFINDDLFSTNKGPMKGHIYVNYWKKTPVARVTMDLKFQFVDLDDVNERSCISKTQIKLNQLENQNRMLRIQNNDLQMQLEKNEESPEKSTVKIRDKTKAKELKDWLNDIVELPAYYKLFIENDIVVDLNEKKK